MTYNPNQTNPPEIPAAVAVDCDYCGRVFSKQDDGIYMVRFLNCCGDERCVREFATDMADRWISVDHANQEKDRKISILEGMIDRRDEKIMHLESMKKWYIEVAERTRREADEFVKLHTTGIKQ